MMDKLIDKYRQEVPLINSEFEFVGIKKNKGRKDKNIITIHHIPCGRTLDIQYGNFRHRKNCKYCDGSYYDQQGFIDRFNKRPDGLDYTILSNYTGMNEYITIRHNVCGKTFKMRADSLIYHNGKCPCEHGKHFNRHSFELLDERIHEKNNEYELYHVDKEPIRVLKDHVKIRHKPCGTVFECIPHNFLSNNNKTCPTCKIYPKNLIGYKDSKGVKIIEDWLQTYQLFYEREKTFNNLISPITNRKLRFDFYVPDLNLIIEFDGKQHFDTRESQIFTKEKYERIRLYDKIKNKYCERNNINLIRIKYTDSTEEYIFKKLNKFLNKSVWVYYITDYN